MFDFNGFDPAKLLTWLVMGLLVLLLIQATRPLQQATPMYDGNSWQTRIHIEDNDTSVCVGYCPDGH